jgi:serine/threonine-protein phosphatase PGAM5
MASRFLYLVRHGEAVGEDGHLTLAGQEQARLTGARLAAVPLAVIAHSPLPRAAQTARLIADCLPGVPVTESGALGDYPPSDPDPATLPPSYARMVTGYSVTERDEGAARARRAVAQFAGAGEEDPAAGAGPAAARHELIVTHNFLIGWFVRHALDAPDWRWLGLNQQHCALTVIRYPADRPAALVIFNDAGHLPGRLRWTGFPEQLRPASG